MYWFETTILSSLLHSLPNLPIFAYNSNHNGQYQDSSYIHLDCRLLNSNLLVWIPFCVLYWPLLCNIFQNHLLKLNFHHNLNWNHSLEKNIIKGVIPLRICFQRTNNTWKVFWIFHSANLVFVIFPFFNTFIISTNWRTFIFSEVWC